MTQNNSNNDSEQQNSNQPNFIPSAVNSGNETGRKKVVKLENHLTSQLRRV